MNSNYCRNCSNPNFFIIQTNEHSSIRKRKEQIKLLQYTAWQAQGAPLKLLKCSAWQARGASPKLLQCIKSHDNQVTVCI